MQEIWKHVPGYDNIYLVSNSGKVKSPVHTIITEDGTERTIPEHEIKPFVGRNGYLRVNLSKGKTRKSYPIHRLVATLFIPNPFKHTIVNHKNENKHDNRAINLEWCSNTYNLRYGTTQQRRVEKIGDKVLAYKEDGSYRKSFLSIRAAAKGTGCPLSEVYKTVKGLRDNYLGYKFILK